MSSTCVDNLQDVPAVRLLIASVAELEQVWMKPKQLCYNTMPFTNIFSFFHQLCILFSQLDIRLLLCFLKQSLQVIALLLDFQQLRVRIGLCLFQNFHSLDNLVRFFKIEVCSKRFKQWFKLLKDLY